MESIAVGIDVSKDHLDVCLGSHQGSERFRVGNDAGGISKILARMPAGATAHFEATGGYERLAKRMLVAAGFEVRIHNPRRIRRFADVQGVTAKTDKLDARVLSQASMLNAPAPAKSCEQEELCDLSRTIQLLKKELAGHRKRRGAPVLSKTLQREFDRMIRVREKEILRMETLYRNAVKATSRCKAYELAQTVRCVGPALARVVSAEFPSDLSNWNKRQIASLAGVAPMDCSSGKTTKTSSVGRHGNVHLKAALYMPALVAVRREEWARILYAKLRAKAKSHRQSIVAVMRRLLIHVFAVLKRGSAWMPEPLSCT